MSLSFSTFEDAEKLSEKKSVPLSPMSDNAERETAAVFSVTPSKEELTLSEDEYPRMDGGIKAWMFCVCAFILEFVVYGFCYSYGILQDHYMTHPPFDKGSSIAIATVGPLAISLQYLPNLPISLAYVRYPDYMILSMWVGLGLYFVSLFCSSFATQVWQLILLQGIILGFGGTLMYVPVLKLISDWFQEKRGLATGIIFAGGGIGGFVIPYVFTAMIAKVGLPWMIRIWAIVTTVVSAIAILGIRPRKPIRKFKNHKERPGFLPPQLVFLKTKLFWSVSVAIFFHSMSYFPITLYIASYTRELTSLLTATIILSLFNSSAVIGQIALGWLSDVIHCSWVMFISTGGTALASYFLWGFSKSSVQVYFFTIIAGFLSGGFSSTWPNIGYEIANRQSEYAGLAITSTALFKGAAAIIGPIVSNILRDSGKGEPLGGGFGQVGYGPVQLFVGTGALAAAVFSIISVWLKPKLNPEEQQEEHKMIATELGVIQTPANASTTSLNTLPNLKQNVKIPEFNMGSLVDILGGYGKHASERNEHNGGSSSSSSKSHQDMESGDLPSNTRIQSAGATVGKSGTGAQSY